MSRLDELEGRIERREAELAVIGLGYVGLPLALAFARAGFRVTGIDVDEDRVEQLGLGRSHVGDVPDEEVQREVQAGRFTATTSYAESGRADCVHICVPTPLTKTKEPDVSFIVAAVEGVRGHLRSGQLIVLGSTTYPGTTHELYRAMLEEGGLEAGRDFSLAFAPERIDPGNQEFALHEVPKVVGGETELCTRLAARLFESVFERVVQVSTSQTAEMVKLLENTFRMINIGLANEVAMICDRLGLDVWEVIEAAATKPYGFMKFLPGPGLGGHCIPVDPNYLAWKLRSLDFNARNCCGDVQVPSLLVDEEPLIDFPSKDDVAIVPVGDDNEWYTYETTFTADFDSAVLKIKGMSEGGADSTLIVDNVFFGTPSGETLLGDCNLDGVLNADDLDCVSDIAQRDAVLGALNTLPGDLDGNGEVAFADFLVLSSNFGKDLPLYTDGNIDLEGGVAFADFLLLSSNFRNAAAAAVPEPSGLMLVAAGVVILLGLRRRR